VTGILKIYCFISIISACVTVLSNVTLWGDLSGERSGIWLDDSFLLSFVRK
jgi:hypothetical protein